MAILETSLIYTESESGLMSRKYTLTLDIKFRSSMQFYLAPLTDKD